MRNTYRRARTDYPKGVFAVYDNGGKTFDRYTVVYTPYPLPSEDFPHKTGTPVFEYVTMSDSPFHPQGFCQHGESVGQRPTGGWGGTCGKVIRFEDLPEDCQQVVEEDLKDQT